MPADLVRVSCGIEAATDLVEDLRQAIAAVTPAGVAELALKGFRGVPIRSEVRRLILLPIVACAVGGGGAFALARVRAASASGPRTVPAEVAQRPETVLPPLPAAHEAKVVEPVAGASTGATGTAPAPAQAPPTDAPRPEAAASAPGDLDLARPSTTGDGIRQATALPNGIALPPLEAPQAVRQMIEAGNVIARSPYLWGGGHGKWVDTRLRLLRLGLVRARLGGIPGVAAGLGPADVLGRARTAASG